ncbi:MAG: hypothetical protein IAC77_00585 [Proteobacteria bacterium]|uniref:Uncharacterized protein n=1 Tax=Candidatus Enterousia excrementavium TaxID=2840789 RepID=A0A940DC91_9PROT|nr:hypothetical protein [Candidatus Enterousia excrementavium]
MGMKCSRCPCVPPQQQRIQTGINGIAACYAQSNDPFIEPSGTFVYDQDCRYQP